MVYMIIANILFLFRKLRIMVESGLDLVHAPNMARPLQYSTIRANPLMKKRSNKVRFLLDNAGSPCYNGYITIRNQEKSIMRD
jgi:hypothetical protein